MRRQPTAAVSQELLNLIVANPVVFLVVQNRNEHVYVRQQILQANFGTEFDGVVRTVSPFRKCLVQWMTLRVHCVTERFKKPAQKSLTTSTWKHGDLCLQGDRRFSQFRSVFTSAAERASQHARDRHAEK